MPEGMEIPEGMTMPEATADNVENSENTENMMSMPTFGNSSSYVGVDFSSMILFATSIIVLAIGIVIAAKFKRRC